MWICGRDVTTLVGNKVEWKQVVACCLLASLSLLAIAATYFLTEAMNDRH